MSGVATGVLSAITAAGQLFGGYGQVTLGPVVLGQSSGLELPESMPIGGKQMLVTHTLPGGQRVISVMGQDDAEISWGGYFDGDTASTDVRTLDKLRRSGQPITLAWDVYSYKVIVSDFKCETRLVPPMRYSITCTVLKDNSFVSGQTLTSLALRVTQDIASGNPLGALSAISSGVVGSSVDNAASAVGVSGATTFGSSLYKTAVNAVSEASSAIKTATQDVNGYLSPIGLSINSIASAAPVAMDVLGFSSKIKSAVSAASDLAILSRSSGFIGRAAANLAGANA